MPGRGREDEREGVVEASRGGDLERLLEVVVGLTGEADDDVGRHGEIGHDPPGLVELGEVPLGGVAPVHGGEDAVGAGLQRVVQVRADGGDVGHRGERLGAHVLRVRRREPDPADAVDVTGGAEQVGEQRTGAGRGIAVAPGRQLEVAPVAVDVLAEQRDLGDAGRGELGDLVDDLVERAGDLDAAHGRHDAEGTVVVAADLDRHPGVVRRLADGRQRRREHGVVVDHRRVEDLGDRSVPACRAQQLDGTVDVVRPHHHVDVPGPLVDEVAVLLGEAAGHDDLAAGALRLPRLEMAEVAVQLVVGVLADAARVEHDDVGVAEVAGRDHPVGFEEAGDALGVVLVHLAPERAHDVAASGHGAPGYRWPSPAFGSLGPCRGHRGRVVTLVLLVSATFVLVALAASAEPVPLAVEGSGGWLDDDDPRREAAQTEPSQEADGDEDDQSDLGGAAGALVQLAALVGAAAIVVLLARTLLRWFQGVEPDSDRRSWSSPPTAPRAELVDAVEYGLVALESGPVDDAIVACWVRLEEAAAGAGVARRPSETPAELTVRLLSRFDVPEDAIDRLLALYRQARYSRRRMSADERQAAIASLQAIGVAIERVPT